MAGYAESKKNYSMLIVMYVQLFVVLLCQLETKYSHYFETINAMHASSYNARASHLCTVRFGAAYIGRL